MSLPAGYALPATLPTLRLGEALVHRIAALAHAAKEPAFRATGTYRFDDPAQVFKTLYCAREFGTCFCETLLRGGRLMVSQADYDKKAAVLLLLNVQRLNLVDMYSTAALMLLGLDLSIVAGSSYVDTQVLGALAYHHASQPHGIVYRSRFDPDQPAMVLFDRAAAYVRHYPGSKARPFAEVTELVDGLRNKLPLKVV